MRESVVNESLHRCAKLAVPLVLYAVFACCQLAMATLASAFEPFGSDPQSSRETQNDAIRRIPAQQLAPDARQLINDVVENPSFFRRMPTTSIESDPDMFRHLVRHPEVLVNIWDVMGITKVQAKRTGPYTFTADDGVGTVCKCDLLYGNDNIHVYYGSGVYKGNMAPRPIHGRCVCVLYNQHGQSAMGEPIIKGSMDVFLKLDNLGADLLTRTLGPLVGKTADSNFTESAKFLTQISQVCTYNPGGAQIMASKLTKVDPHVRDEFSRIAERIAMKASRFDESEHFTANSQDSARPLPLPPGGSRDGEVPSPRSQRELALASPPADRVPPMNYRAEASELQLTPSPQATTRPTPVGKELRPAPAARSTGVTPGRPRSPRGAISPAKPNVYMRR